MNLPGMQVEISIHKLIVFLYNNNKQFENKIKNSITIASKKIKYLVVCFAKKVQELHAENCKILLKEIKHLNK